MEPQIQPFIRCTGAETENATYGGQTTMCKNTRGLLCLSIFSIICEKAEAEAVEPSPVTNRLASVILFALKQEQNYSCTHTLLGHITITAVMRYSWNTSYMVTLYPKR